MKYQADKTAVLVIDVQQGMFNKTTPLHHAAQLLENINTLIRNAREAGAPVIFIQHSNDTYLKMGTDDWQLHPEIQPLEDEELIYKLKGNAFEGTNLHEKLQRSAVDTVLICGLVTHGCVKATSLGAMEKGYRVLLIQDAHSSYSKDASQLIEKWNQTLMEQGAQLIETKDVRFG